MRFELRQNGEVVVRAVDELAQRLADAQEVLEDFGEHMVYTSVPKNFSAGGRPKPWAKSPWTSSQVQSDRGHLLRSVRHELLNRRLRVGSNLRYARQRHHGGELRPRKARALAVPLPDVPRTMARPRRWGKRLFMLPPTKGDPNTVGILAARVGRGKSARVEAKFALRTRVVQPARPFLLFQDEDIAYFSRSLVKWAETGEVGG